MEPGRRGLSIGEVSLRSNDLPTEFFKWREMAADRNQWRAICGFETLSATKDTPTSFRQDIWAKLRYGDVPLWVQKLTRKFKKSKQNEQKEREKIHTVRPAGLKTRRSFSYTIITKIPVFDCAVALCTMQNWLLVISNLTWLDCSWKVIYEIKYLFTTHVTKHIAAEAIHPKQQVVSVA
jgi:hypothetical protein